MCGIQANHRVKRRQLPQKFKRQKLVVANMKPPGRQPAKDMQVLRLVQVGGRQFQVYTPRCQNSAGMQSPLLPMLELSPSVGAPSANLFIGGQQITIHCFKPAVIALGKCLAKSLHVSALHLPLLNHRAPRAPAKTKLSQLSEKE